MFHFPPPAELRHRGMALVVVLALLVIASVILVAYVTATRLDRAATVGYGQAIRAEQIAQGGLNLVIGNLQEEMAKDGPPDLIEGVPIYTNITSDNVLPERVGGVASMPSVIKISTDAPFFTGAVGGLRASNINTTTENAVTRAIRLERWNRPQLGSFSDPAEAPSWIYVTRDGPTNGGTLSFGTSGNAANNPVPENFDFVLGRFAYVVYDVGGLLDITVAGYPFSGSDVTTIEAGRKGTLALTELTEIPGLGSQAIVEELVGWRNAASIASSYANYIHSIAPAHGLLRVVPGDNTFVGRADLISYAETNGITAALPYLTTFSRERNSPSLGPGVDSSLNPDFRKLIFDGKPITRFPVSRLELLDSDPSALSVEQRDKIFEYFGLRPAVGASDTWRTWTYRASTIGTPQAALDAGRVPDLFELLKAAITIGSLGVDEEKSKSSAASSNPQVREVGSDAYTPETNIDHHVARIVANMIDQTDADNFPTTIVLGNNPITDVNVYGIENLPYFADWLIRLKYPSGNLEDVANAVAQMRFKLWNPHQGTPPATGPSQIRVIVNPEAEYGFYYFAPGTTPHRSVWTDRNSANRTRLYPSTFVAEGVDVGSIGQYAIPNFTPTLALERPNQGIAPGTTGTRNIEMRTLATTFSLQYRDGNGLWRTYTTFAGHANDGGRTGIQNTNVWVSNNNRITNTEGDEKDWEKPEASFPKPDPRTFRYRTGYAQGHHADYPHLGGMVPAGDPGQIINQKLPAFFSGGTRIGMLYKNDGSHGIAVQDSDGIARKADGYLGANPMQSGSAARPVILNRPFRSVGELGHVFRDAPWKSLNFFSGDSGDASLLDLFCLEEGEITAGKVSLNTPHPEVLRAILRGVARHEIGGGAVSESEAGLIAGELVAQTQNAPFINRSDLVAHFATTDVNAAWPAEKIRREAPVRALASVTQTRTWNLLIDLIAQSGRFAATASSLPEFTVEGERRFWMHVAIDRITGEVIETQLEPVYD